MKKLYEEFFYVPKHGKVREKVMLARIGTSIALILICMVAMSVSAYAYFSCNIASGISSIQAAQYQLDVKAPGEMTPNTLTGGYELVGGAEGATYEFTLTKSTAENTASVGFAEIQIVDSSNADIVKKYYTNPIGTQLEGEEGNPSEKKIDTCVVKIAVPKEKTVQVYFIPQWGTGATPNPCTLAGDATVGWYWTTEIDCSTLYGTESSEGVTTDTQDQNSGTGSSGADSADTATASPSSASTDTTQNAGTPVDTGTVTDSSTESNAETPSDTAVSTDTAQTPSSQSSTSEGNESPADNGTATDTAESTASQSGNTDASNAE